MSRDGYRFLVVTTLAFCVGAFFILIVTALMS